MTTTTKLAGAIMTTAIPYPLAGQHEAGGGGRVNVVMRPLRDPVTTWTHKERDDRNDDVGGRHVLAGRVNASGRQRR